MELRRIDLREYADALPAEGVEPFHDPAALTAVRDHFPGDLELYGAYKGQQAVGAFPAFVREVGPVRVVTSPPPGMGIPRLGPVVSPASPKQRKREKVHRRVVESLLERLEDQRTVVRIATPAGYPDPRPFAWNGLTVAPRFTYRVDADRDPDAILRSFSRSLRREINDGLELDATVQREGVAGARRAFTETRDRYEQQDEPFAIEWPYVKNLFDRLDDRARSYVLRDDGGNCLSALTVLYSPTSAYYWQGATRTHHRGVDVAALLHWRVLCDLVEDPPESTVHTYDLVGANTDHLCRYKAKFDGRLVPYYQVDSDGVLATGARTAYRIARNGPLR